MSEFEYQQRKNNKIRDAILLRDQIYAECPSLENAVRINEEKRRQDRELDHLREEVANSTKEVAYHRHTSFNSKKQQRLSELLDTTAEPENYTENSFYQNATAEINAAAMHEFLKHIEKFSESMRHGRNLGLSVGVEAFSFNLDEWYDAIVSDRNNAVLYARLLSTNDAFLRKYQEPYLILDYLVRTPEDPGLVQSLTEHLSKAIDGNDLELWRRERSITILDSIMRTEKRDGNLRITGMKSATPEQLITNIPDFTLKSAIYLQRGTGAMHSSYATSPFGLNSTLGIKPEFDGSLSGQVEAVMNISQEVLSSLERNHVRELTR